VQRPIKLVSIAKVLTKEGSVALKEQCENIWSIFTKNYTNSDGCRDSCKDKSYGYSKENLRCTLA